MARTRLFLLLSEQVKKIVDSESASVSSGQAPDYPSYKERCGYIRGLNTALELCDQIEEEFNK